MTSSPTGRPGLKIGLLTIAGIGGLILAAAGMSSRPGPSGSALPDGAVARVEGGLISRRDYESLAADLAADSRAPLDPADRRFVLDRLIDEELLVLRGLELGLPDRDPAVRKALVAAVLAQVTAEAEAAPLEDDEVRALYDRDPEFFRTGDRFRVRWWHVPESDATAMRRMTGVREHIATSRTSFDSSTPGAAPDTALPDTALPASKLRDYLGPALTERVRAASAGDVIGPVRSAGEIHVLAIDAIHPGQVPRFEDIRDTVAAELSRRRGSAALRDYLAGLRARADIQRDDAFAD